MAGLLYKDFVAIHGKLYVGVLLSVTLFLTVFSMVPLSGDFGNDLAVVVGALVALMAMVLPMIVTSSIENNIIMADAGAKKKAFLLSLPVSRKQYVASKYLFVLICYYVILSVTVIWVQFANSRMEEALQDSLLMDAMGIMPLWVQACLLVSAVELPFFVVVGVKAGNAIKTGISFVLFFVVFGYMLFGDISFLEHFDLGMLMAWMEEHLEVMTALQVMCPIVSGVLYYLSYGIAVTLFARKEPGDEA